MVESCILCSFSQTCFTGPSSFFEVSILEVPEKLVSWQGSKWVALSPLLVHERPDSDIPSLLDISFLDMELVDVFGTSANF